MGSCASILGKDSRRNCATVAAMPYTKKKRKAAIPKVLRKAVWDKYIGEEVGSTMCMCCAGTTISQLNFHCGHVLAEANGGSTTIENLRPICASCNLCMRDKHMRSFQQEFFPKAKPILTVDEKVRG